VRKAVAIIPVLPKVEINTNPIEEQLAQALDNNVKNELEINDLSNLILEFLNRQTFIETTTPRSSALAVDKMNPNIASFGK